MKAGNNLKAIPRASVVLKKKLDEQGKDTKQKEKLKQTFKLGVLNLLKKFDEYSGKSIETIHQEILDKLKDAFNIPENLSNEICIKYEKGKFIESIYLRGDSINITTHVGEDVIKHSINKKNINHVCNDVRFWNTGNTVALTLDEAVDEFIKNKEICEITVKNE